LFLHYFFFQSSLHNPLVHSFPTRRSSDLTRIKTVDMERYIFRVRPDGLFILNIGDTNEKIRIAARFMGRFDPGRVLAVSSRLYRSEEHTSELQSRGHLVCRLLLEKKTIIK